MAEKRSMREVIAEAEREFGNFPHVMSPAAPVLIFGVMPSVGEAEATSWAEHAQDAKGRSLRSDGLCLAAGVISAPATFTEQQWTAMRSDALKWLEQKYGNCLKSVIEHTDEAYPHLHFYVVPKVGQRFESIDEGRAASKQAAGQGLVKSE